MNIFRISTTAYEEEDFYLHTEIDEVDIVEVVTPIVNAERDGCERILDHSDNRQQHGSEHDCGERIGWHAGGYHGKCSGL